MHYVELIVGVLIAVYVCAMAFCLIMAILSGINYKTPACPIGSAYVARMDVCLSGASEPRYDH